MSKDIVLVEKSSATVPVRSSQEILDDMDDQVREIASATAKTLQEGSFFSIVTNYRLGSALLKLRSLAHLGDVALEKQVALISAYWTSLGFPCRTGDAYALVAVVSNFTLDYLKAQHEEPMTSGQQLSWAHFMHLTKVAADLRAPWLKKIREDSLSANQLQLALTSADLVQNKRFGGRKPTIPTAAPTIMNATRAKFAGARRFIEEAGTVFSGICLEYPADLVDENYVSQTSQALKELDELMKCLSQVKPELQKAHERAEAILQKRAEEEAVEDAEILKVEKKKKKVKGAATKAKPKAKAKGARKAPAGR